MGVVSLARTQVALQKLYLIGPPVRHYAFNVIVLLNQPSLVIQGEGDVVVPAQQVFDWAAQQQLPIINFEGCSHFFHGRLVELRQFLLEHLYASLG